MEFVSTKEEEDEEKGMASMVTKSLHVAIRWLRMQPPFEYVGEAQGCSKALVRPFALPVSRRSSFAQNGVGVLESLIGAPRALGFKSHEFTKQEVEFS